MTGPAVFHRISGLILRADAGEILATAPVLTEEIPELAPMVGFDQRSPYHGYDLFTHTAHVVAAVPEELTVRWAALLHDVGKVPCFTVDENGRGHFSGHDQKGAELAERILRRLEAPEELRRQAAVLIRNHMTYLPPDAGALRKTADALGYDTTRKLLSLQAADMSGKGRENRREGELLRQLQDLLETIAPQTL